MPVHPRPFPHEIFRNTKSRIGHGSSSRSRRRRFPRPSVSVLVGAWEDRPTFPFQGPLALLSALGLSNLDLVIPLRKFRVRIKSVADDRKRRLGLSIFLAAARNKQGDCEGNTQRLTRRAIHGDLPKGFYCCSINTVRCEFIISKKVGQFKQFSIFVQR